MRACDAKFGLMVVLVAMTYACGSSSAADVLEPDAVVDSGRDAVVDSGMDAGADVTGDSAVDVVVPDPPTGKPWVKIETGETFLRGPFIQMAGTDSVTIVWRLAADVTEPGEGCVDYSWGAGTMTACGTADKNSQYEIPLNGLPVETEITYSVRVGQTKTVDLTFRTMPAEPKSMKMLVYADAHNTPETLAKMSEIALAEGVDFGFCVGDVASTPTDEEYDQYFAGVRNLASRVNLWAVPGNHDDYEVLKFFESFVLPQGSTSPDDISGGYAEGYWDRRIGNVWVGGGWVRDFYLSAPDSDWGEVGFFRQRFQSDEYRTATWKLFFIHQPAYVAEWPGCDYTGEECLKTAMIPMARDAGIQATFHGHMHGVEYGQVDGVNTFVVGGVGNGLDAVDEEPCALLDGWPEPWTRIYGKHAFAIVETGADKMTVRILSVDNETLATVDIPVSQPPAAN